MEEINPTARDNLGNLPVIPDATPILADGQVSPVDTPDGWMTAAEVARGFELTVEGAAARIGELAANHGLEYEIRRLPDGKRVRAFPPENAAILQGLVAELLGVGEANKPSAKDTDI